MVVNHRRLSTLPVCQVAWGQISKLQLFQANELQWLKTLFNGVCYVDQLLLNKEKS